MSTKALSDYTFASRYARYDKTKKEEKLGTKLLSVLKACILQNTQW